MKLLDFALTADPTDSNWRMVTEEEFITPDTEFSFESIDFLPDEITVIDSVSSFWDAFCSWVGYFDDRYVEDENEIKNFVDEYCFEKNQELEKERNNART